MESLETLQKIKELEAESERKEQRAKETANKIIEDAEKERAEKLRKADKLAGEIISSKIEEVETQISRQREEEIKKAVEEAKKVKPLEKKELLEILKETIKEEFKV